MSEKMDTTARTRRDVLRSGAALGGGLLASAVTGDRVAADSNGGVGYISRSTYRLLTGDEDADCVDGGDGWGGSFYLHGAAEDGGGDAGISVSLPATCDGDGPHRSHVAQLVTATERTDLDGGPGGDGPWGEDCGSWLFVAGDETVETSTDYRVTEVHGPSPPAACHEGVTATNSNGVEIGAPMDLLRVSFAPASDPDEWTRAAELPAHSESVAVDGTSVVVGARSDEPSKAPSAGSASVYTHSAGFWYREATLRADDGPGEVVGSDVAIDGDTAVVTATGEAAGASAVAHVFGRSDGVWSRQATLTTDDATRSGTAVAIDGETVVVGAEASGGERRGAAYVFAHTADGWTQQARLTVDDAGGFGTAVGVADDTAVVGAPTTDLQSAPAAGAAYVFTRDDDWGRQTTLTAAAPDAGDELGGTVAIDGGTVLAGATAADPTDERRRASPVSVFTRAGGDWGRQAKLTPDDAGPRGWFGQSVALDTDTAIIGAEAFDGKGNAARGGADVFSRSGDQWHRERTLTPADESTDGFGVSVALDGGYAVVGASDAAPKGPRSGATYLFES